VIISHIKLWRQVLLCELSVFVKYLVTETKIWFLHFIPQIQTCLNQGEGQVSATDPLKALVCHGELFVGQVPEASPLMCADIETFWLLVQLLYHKTTVDLWELWLLIKTIKSVCCSFADEESSLNLYSLHRLIVIWLSVCWHISAVLSRKVRAFNSSYYLHLTSNTSIFMTYAKLTDRPQTEQPNLPNYRQIKTY